MTVKQQIKDHLATIREPKHAEMQELHKRILKALPGCKLWFFDGTDASGKVITNPTIGYGAYTIKYAGGKTREYFQIGLLANSTGISVHILGIDDKKYLADTFGKTIGKASVTGYCIKFKKLQDINADVLISAILAGVEAQKGKYYQKR